jgi:hypothetical protein
LRGPIRSFSKAIHGGYRSRSLNAVARERVQIETAANGQKMKTLLHIFVIFFTFAAIICWLGSVLLSIGIIKNIRPGLRVWKDLGGNPMNAVLSKKLLTERGVKIRYYLFICYFGFFVCLAAAGTLAFLRDLL